MPAKPTEEQIRSVIAALDGIIEAGSENMCDAMKVKDVLQWVLGEENDFGPFAARIEATMAEEPDQDQAHSE